MLADLQNDLRELASPERARITARFFKTGKGEYGEGDVFIGITNPQVRTAVKPYADLPLDDLQTLLESEIHEFRFAALLILVKQFQKQKARREELFRFYLTNLNHVNNWDLVDTSCHEIVGAYLLDKTDRSLLDEMTEVPHLWTQRVAMVSTWHFIRKGQFADAIRIAQKLLSHPHDLIHKAVGWMLREVWSKGGQAEVEDFLEKFATVMPRTALRYAIEKMTPDQRQRWMKKK